MPSGGSSPLAVWPPAWAMLAAGLSHGPTRLVEGEDPTRSIPPGHPFQSGWIWGRPPGLWAWMLFAPQEQSHGTWGSAPRGRKPPSFAAQITLLKKAAAHPFPKLTYSEQQQRPRNGDFASCGLTPRWRKCQPQPSCHSHCCGDVPEINPEVLLSHSFGDVQIVPKFSPMTDGCWDLWNPDHGP